MNSEGYCLFSLAISDEELQFLSIVVNILKLFSLSLTLQHKINGFPKYLLAGPGLGLAEDLKIISQSM
jgi:hypothetical protein